MADNELSVTRQIAARPEKVWEVMATRQGEWFCPAPWRADVIEQDQRPGGRDAMVFRGPDGEEMPQEGVYLAFEPGKRIVTTDAMTADFQPAEPFMIGIWEIEAKDGGTLYTATARHWSAEACKQHRDMGFVEGWEACAAQLAEICERES